MATISFHADAGYPITNLAGSGLGFFGASFGQSVEVGAYQSTTYITDGNGSTNGGSVDNIKYVHADSGVTPGGMYLLQKIPNRYATLNIRFSHTEAISVQNAKIKIFDRTTTTNVASGVTVQTAELIHPGYDEAGGTGSGDSEWKTHAVGDNEMTLTDSPGQSGFNAMAASADTRHDWFVAISASPDSIGSKTLFGLYVELEYL